MEARPLRSFPHSNTGRGAGPLKSDDAARTLMMVEVKKESKRPVNDELPASLSPSINLGLEIGSKLVGNQNSSTGMVHWQGESVLTSSQLHELQQQVLIHKHLAAGLRVPTHLLIPIWKSVASTLGSDINGIYERYSGFLGFSPLGFDYRMMDSEPGRCRRTDGKKWRCSRNTVPHQKYCERHMHRGRQRSRKPVEASETDSPSKTIILNNPDRDVGCVVAAPVNTNSSNNKTKNQFSCNFSTAITFPLIPEAIIASPKTACETVTSSTHATKSMQTSCADATKTISMVSGSATNTTATRVTTFPCVNPSATASIRTSCIIDLKDVCNMNCGENCRKNQNDFRRNDINAQKIPSSGFRFSPNSVLQVPSCSSSCYDSKINIELEPGRCRRTDGKKWRCRRDVIPNHKYCGLHVHRGSKKHLKASHKVAVLASSAATSRITLLPSAATLLAKTEPATLNTNLSMSIQAGDKQKHNEERSNVSCSSETTITDTTITAYENFSS